MDKEAIEKILTLAPPTEIDVDGRHYSDKTLRRKMAGAASVIAKSCRVRAMLPPVSRDFLRRHKWH